MFDKLSRNQDDLIEFIDSNGQKQELLWTLDEDDMLKKHY